MEPTQKPAFTITSLVDELRQAFSISGEAEVIDTNAWYTTRELVELLGVSTESVRRQLRVIMQADQLEIGQKRVPCLGNRKSMLVDAYRVRPKEMSNEDGKRS